MLWRLGPEETHGNIVFKGGQTPRDELLQLQRFGLEEKSLEDIMDAFQHSKHGGEEKGIESLPLTSKTSPHSLGDNVASDKIPLLLQRFPEPNKAKNIEQQREAEGRELAAAAGTGDLSEVTRLVNKGALPSSFDYDRRTPLHTASVGGHLAICKFLLTFPEVNVNALDRWRNTPLSEAIANKVCLVHW